MLSGGVGANEFIRMALRRVCAFYGYSLVCPPARMCTDNGVMVAWNALELMRANVTAQQTIVHDAASTQQSVADGPLLIAQQEVVGRSPIGIDISQQVRRTSLGKEPKIALI